MNLIAITENLWTTPQPLKFFGIEIGTRMTIVRLKNGDLVLISPIHLRESDRPSLDAIGTVKHIIAPNLFHHLFAGQVQALYPEAKLWGVEGLAEKRSDLKLDGLLNQADTFEHELDYFPFEGFEAWIPPRIVAANETVFFHRPSRTLIVTDTAFNFGEADTLGTQLVARVLGSYNHLRPTRLEKWGTRDKDAVERSVRRVLEWDFDRVIMAHGVMVETDGKAQFREGYEWFLGRSLVS